MKNYVRVDDFWIQYQYLDIAVTEFTQAFRISPSQIRVESDELDALVMLCREESTALSVEQGQSQGFVDGAWVLNREREESPS